MAISGIINSYFIKRTEGPFRKETNGQWAIRNKFATFIQATNTTIKDKTGVTRLLSTVAGSLKIVELVKGAKELAPGFVKASSTLSHFIGLTYLIDSIAYFTLRDKPTDKMTPFKQDLADKRYFGIAQNLCFLGGGALAVGVAVASFLPLAGVSAAIASVPVFGALIVSFPVVPVMSALFVAGLGFGVAHVAQKLGEQKPEERDYLGAFASVLSKGAFMVLIAAEGVFAPIPLAILGTVAAGAGLFSIFKGNYDEANKANKKA